MKINLGAFLVKLRILAPLILSLTPLGPIAQSVIAAIEDAEKLLGDGTGPQKLAYVIDEVKQAASILNGVKGHVVIDPDTIAGATAQVIAALIAVVNATKPPINIA